MPVTAKLSKRLYEVLGEDVANELVTWFNDVDATYRADLRELNALNFTRFDARLEQRLEQLVIRHAAVQPFAPACDVRVTYRRPTGARFAAVILRFGYMIDKRRARRLLGETMRDIGILVFVFGPLDAFYQEVHPASLTVALMVALGLLYIAIGIIVESEK